MLGARSGIHSDGGGIAMEKDVRYANTRASLSRRHYAITFCLTTSDSEEQTRSSLEAQLRLQGNEVAVENQENLPNTFSSTMSLYKRINIGVH